jgi:hypothetical protein
MLAILDLRLGLAFGLCGNVADSLRYVTADRHGRRGYRPGQRESACSCSSLPMVLAMSIGRCELERVPQSPMQGSTPN